MYDAGTLNNTKGNPGAPQSSFVLNPTSVDVAGSYRPSNSSIIFLFAENTTLSATNNSFFQGSFYSPEAMVNIATSGLSGLNVTDSAGGKMTVQCCAVGVVIANSFGNANTAFYVYTKPSTTSVMQNAKGGKDDSAFGYTFDRYVIITNWSEYTHEKNSKNKKGYDSCRGHHSNGTFVRYVSYVCYSCCSGQKQNLENYYRNNEMYTQAVNAESSIMINKTVNMNELKVNKFLQAAKLQNRVCPEADFGSGIKFNTPSLWLQSKSLIILMKTEAISLNFFKVGHQTLPNPERAYIG